MFKHKELLNIKRTFYLLDSDFSGDITVANLKEGLLRLEAESGEQMFSDIDSEVARIFECVDFNKSGDINYTEFVCAALEPGVHLTEENVKNSFLYLDALNEKAITVEGICRVF
mmetsp:Transcript_31220/g.23202  ORF Transcript_31220/g.23202 Transcript_31220/m.23202 type:complete len:114 (+) Transcript_31220:425-766(+)